MNVHGDSLVSTVNLLTYPAAKFYFELREQHAYYMSLKAVEAKRGLHSQLIESCLGFLDATKDAVGRSAVDAVIAGDRKRAKSCENGSDIVAEVVRREPVGGRLLNMPSPLTLESLKSCYRSAAARHHPDCGGDTAAMVAVNRAYAEAHELLLMSELFASQDVHDISVNDRWRGLRCVDYRVSAHHLLFTIFLDDWALDFAVLQLRWLVVAMEKMTYRLKEHFDLAMLVPEVSKLASRLSLTALADDASFSLELLQNGVKQARKKQLSYDSFLVGVRNARKPKIVLNHVRQLENARRLNIVTGKQYDKVLLRISKKEAEEAFRKEQQDHAVIEFSRSRGFLSGLPTDSCAIGKRVSQALVPEPGYFSHRMEELSDEQQAEYLKAFCEPITPSLTRKYLYVRLQSFFESAMLFDIGLDYERMVAEAQLLSNIKGDSPNVYALEVVECILYIASLLDDERSKRCSFLSRVFSGTWYRNGTSNVVFFGSSSFGGRLRLNRECFEVVRLEMVDLKRKFDV